MRLNLPFEAAKMFLMSVGPRLFSFKYLKIVALMS